MEHTVNWQAFIDTIPDEMNRWGVPGTALGIIHHGKTAFCGGLGVRCAGEDAPVTEDTMFAIGSATKAFTATVAAILVEDGLLAWDEPICRYLPDFKMYDEFATAHLTVRDMLCHRSGLPRHEFMWYNADITRKEIFEHLRYLEPNCDLRTAWQYNNSMYASVGYLVEAVSGHSWEELVQTRIFDPLGMTGSNFSVETVKQYPEAAKPHAPGPDGPMVIPYCNLDVIGPAGSINSTLRDMMQWLRFHLSDGTVDGRKILSPENMRQLHAMEIPCQAFAWSFKESKASGYALGWFTEVFRGADMVSHAGNIDGFSALVGFLPEENSGVVLLSNLNNNFLNYAVEYETFDRVLGVSGGDWSRRQKAALDDFLAVMTKMQREAMGTAQTAPYAVSADALAQYVGCYTHPAYGTAEIVPEGDGLVMHYHKTDFAMAATGPDTFGINYPLLSIAFPATFDLAAGTLTIPFEASVSPIVFHRG